MQDAQDQPLDALVIGAGPAGLAGSLYLRRFHRRVELIDRGDSRAQRIPLSHNVPGFPRGIAGRELLARMREQLQEASGKVRLGCVERLEREGDEFIARLDDGTSLRARFVLLATGTTDHEPQLPGVAELRAAGLLRQCPICDGHEFAGRRIAVIGSGLHGVREARFLRHFSERILFIASHAPAEPDDALLTVLRERDIDMLPGTAIAMRPLPDDGVEITMTGGQTTHADVVYSALGCNPHAELAVALGAATDDSGNLMIDGHCRTSVEGLYAAGDVTAGLDQISVAAGQAAIAATAIHNAL
ncbi:MAG TPA: NAD(P)/FAD-dependent oxidoreductase [Burkholderiaceae bacterium]|nr:NAD(P)/FAD-dependent oxidoreductase [Burkholderiaceae bacterium]